MYAFELPIMRVTSGIVLLVVSGFALPISMDGAEARHAEFSAEVRPALERFCFDCHDSGSKKADVDLEQFDSEAAFWRNPKLWERVEVQLRERVMPPPKKKQPGDDERARLTEWIHSALEHPDVELVPHDPGPPSLHRLSRVEYNNTVRDLLGVDTHPADAFPPDGGGGGGFDNNASTLFVPPILLEKFWDASAKIVAAAKPELLHKAQAGSSGYRAELADLARRAFRRPVETAEVDRLASVYDSATARGETPGDAFALATRAVLISPHFLFRIETERGDGAEPYAITDFELASRLSYFLWSSMPDEELFARAAEGRLREPGMLEKQVARMLADPKAHALAENFASQWLRTKELYTSVAPAPDKFPQYTAELRDAFYAEPLEFFGALLRNNLPVSDLLDCDYTYANEILSHFYGISDVKGPAMRRVALPDHARGGILGMGGVLALTSYPRRTSPVLRGKWVMEEILGTPPAPPPPMVNTQKLGGEKPQDGLTFRQRMERHREDPKCAGCHARMDPLGFGLENFDAIGAWRTEVGGASVDSAGKLVTGEPFSGPAELKRLLMERKEAFLRNLTEKMLSYALGRGIEPADWWPVQQIAKAVAADGYRSQRLALEIARSYPFQYRKSSSNTKIALTTP